MSYSLCFRLASFGSLPIGAAAAVVVHLVEAIAVANEAFLRAHPGVPELYRSGVQYVPDERGTELQWWDVPAVLSQGYADCKALAAWRIAEHRLAGRAAWPIVTYEGPPGRELFHVTVATQYRREDPSCLLGMCPP